ncbi:28S ribosomal protein S7, mitochondrial [Athalia rosae]|uniref:28S ribosomal protein S7, mitochondrial n=1 Tax=Athalia rosae TaxID=37344 RepID=UPI002033A7DD|nr:28S ribosomal protein S7, mitochondrial [Athalia rosae]
MAALKMFPKSVAPVRYFLSINRWIEISFKNNYSVFPSYYVKPVFRKEQQSLLEGTEEGEKLAHTPIKPAKNHQTSSAFYDDLTRQFTNYIMEGGRKVLARQLLESTFENIKRLQLERYNKANPSQQALIEVDPKVIFHTAVENSKPLLKLTSIRRGGVTYKVPVPISDKNAQWVAMKWLLTAAKDKDRKIHLPEKLAWELIDAFNNQGRVIKQKQDLHRQCEANRAYAHYRWS